MKRLLPILLLCAAAKGGDVLQPTATQPGTAEESGIITTLALTYVKVRNTVRDAYMSIQYTRAMVQTLEEQRDWVKRNLKQWDLVGKRVVRLVEDPGRWDEKLLDLESLFDKTDYLLWEEPKIFDYLMYRQESYAARLTGHIGNLIPKGMPLVSDFYKVNGSLYRADPSFIPHVAGVNESEDKLHGALEAQRLGNAYEAMKGSPEGKVRDATIFAASRAQAQVASLLRVQKERAEGYGKMEALAQKAGNLNAAELSRTLSDLRGVEGEMDDLLLQKLEMEMVFAHLGTSIYDLTKERAEELRASASFSELAETLK